MPSCRPLAMAIALATAGCGDPTGSGEAGPPAQLVGLPAGQLGIPGQPTPVAPAFLVLDAEGRPVPNARVTFTVQSGGGSVTPGDVVTDAKGVATAGAWTLGTSAGPQTLRAATEQLSRDVTALATEGEKLYVFAIAAGAAHACAYGAITQFSYPVATCWGRNTAGQLAAADGAPYHATPVGLLVGSTRFGGAPTFALGRDHTCAMHSDDGPSSGPLTLQCWGSNLKGQLGVAEHRATTASLSAPAYTYRLLAGAGHTCLGESSPTTIRCWGDNAAGQLGDGTTEERDFATAAVPTPFGEDRLSALAAGDEFTCAITRTPTLASEKVYCWGRNDVGQLGDGTTTDRRSPVRVPIEFSQVAYLPVLASGAAHTCLIKAVVPLLTVGSTETAKGPMYCWGRNDFGQLGDGTTTNRSSPVLAAGGMLFSEVTLGTTHTCGVADQAVYCWGSNSDGQLGIGSVGALSLTPMRITSVQYFLGVAAGDRYTCGIDGMRNGYCWGLNAEGQLGDGTTTSRSVPTPIAFGP